MTDHAGVSRRSSERRQEMNSVLYPGSFDPFTNGHLDLVARAAKIFDEVIVAVAINQAKKPLFSIEERMEMIRESCEETGITNARVVTFRGLLVDAISHFRANAVLRGLRAFSDFEYELQMALMNRSMSAACETIFMMPNAQTSFVSSHMVKEVAQLGGDFSQYVPPPVVRAMMRVLAGEEA